MTTITRIRRQLAALIRIVLPFGVLTLAAGCSTMKPADLADYVSVARITSFVACREVSQSLKASEREPLHAALIITLGGLRSGRLADINAALDDLHLQDPAYRLLVAEGLQLAARRVPDGVIEGHAASIAVSAVQGCADGVTAGAPQP